MPLQKEFYLQFRVHTRNNWGTSGTTGTGCLQINYNICKINYGHYPSYPHKKSYNLSKFNGYTFFVFFNNILHCRPIIPFFQKKVNKKYWNSIKA